ncbi:MAG: hypothetical protein HY858_03280 [Candidatus Solibacter usitatus]|nr:hypothetical protein [Candidatus Solibacter usitatus]
MNRRDFLYAATVAANAPIRADSPLVVPVHRVTDSRIRATPQQLRNFWWTIWPEAVRDFSRCGIQLQCTDERGEIRLSPASKPVILGLRRGVVNLVITDHISMEWDKARALAGITGFHAGYCVCAVALRYAHGHQIPFLSVNTCVHELLHALLQDIFVNRPSWYQTAGRESRIDWYATHLWLFGEGGAIRQSAHACLTRLRSAASET